MHRLFKASIPRTQEMYVEENDYFAQDAPRILIPLVYEGDRASTALHYKCISPPLPKIMLGKSKQMCYDITKR